jgi:16S rRNA (cytidine1402-2'-O)-methyltransferase
VIPIPGPSAVVSALSVAGIPTDKFLFLGFLPNNIKKAEIILSRHKDIDATLVLFESPKRIHNTLLSIIKIMGDRKACIARELTKIHEEIVFDDVNNLYEFYKDQKIKGEIVILIEGSKDSYLFDDEAIREMLKHEISTGVTFSEAIKNISIESNINKKRVYDIAMGLKAGLKG